MKKIISLLALIGILFTSNSVEAKNNKSHESVTAKRPTILKKTFIKNDQTYKNAYKYDENGNLERARSGHGVQTRTWKNGNLIKQIGNI